MFLLLHKKHLMYTVTSALFVERMEAGRLTQNPRIPTSNVDFLGFTYNLEAARIYLL